MPPWNGALKFCEVWHDRQFEIHRGFRRAIRDVADFPAIFFLAPFFATFFPAFTGFFLEVFLGTVFFLTTFFFVVFFVGEGLAATFFFTDFFLTFPGAVFLLGLAAFFDA